MSASVGFLALPILALADVDASYGRLDGDVAIAASAGAASGPVRPTSEGGGDGGVRFDADLRLRYLQTAGVFGTVEAGRARVISTGIELRPLFVSRWALGREIGYSRLDMLIDSTAIEVGVSFLHDQGMKRALQTSIGFELPFLPSATGPFLGFHAGFRWTDAALAGNGGGLGFVALTLGWQQIFSGHVVDFEERR